MKNQKRVQHLDNVARQLAPSLKHKFDLSSEDDFKKWAELSFKSAEAFVARGEVLMEEAGKKDAEEFAKDQAAKAKAEAAQRENIKPPAPLVEIKPEGEPAQ